MNLPFGDICICLRRSDRIPLLAEKGYRVSVAGFEVRDVFRESVCVVRVDKSHGLDNRRSKEGEYVKKNIHNLACHICVDCSVLEADTFLALLLALALSIRLVLQFCLSQFGCSLSSAGGKHNRPFIVAHVAFNSNGLRHSSFQRF